MATHDFKLSEPPSDSRQRALWMQHGIGFILFQDVRDYALQQIAPSLKDDEKWKPNWLGLRGNGTLIVTNYERHRIALVFD